MRRVPLQSAIAATVRSCIRSAADLLPGGNCGYQGPGIDADNPATPGNEETLPVDTLSIFFEYPENIQMYGVSFNTTEGDRAWSGEFAYRPALPTQVHTLDVVLAALGPSFPDTPVVVPGVATLYQRYAFPDFNAIHLKLFDPMGMEREAEVFTSSTTYTLSHAGAMAGEWRFQVLNGPRVMPMPSYNYLANVSDQYGSGGGGGGGGGAVSGASILLLTVMRLLHQRWRRSRVA